MVTADGLTAEKGKDMDYPNQSANRKHSINSMYVYVWKSKNSFICANVRKCYTATDGLIQRRAARVIKLREIRVLSSSKFKKAKVRAGDRMRLRERE